MDNREEKIKKLLELAELLTAEQWEILVAEVVQEEKTQRCEE